MAKTKGKLNNKGMDILGKTKKAGAEPQVISMRTTRSRSRSRTPGRINYQSTTYYDDDKDDISKVSSPSMPHLSPFTPAVAPVKRGRGRPPKTPVAKSASKASTPSKAKSSSAKKPAAKTPKRVGKAQPKTKSSSSKRAKSKEPAKSSARRSQSRSRTTKKPTPKAKTPPAPRPGTRKSTRQATLNNSAARKSTIHNDIKPTSVSRSQSSTSMASAKSTGGGWFSRCAIV